MKKQDFCRIFLKIIFPISKFFEILSWESVINPLFIILFIFISIIHSIGWEKLSIDNIAIVGVKYISKKKLDSKRKENY